MSIQTENGYPKYVMGPFNIALKLWHPQTGQYHSEKCKCWVASKRVDPSKIVISELNHSQLRNQIGNELIPITEEQYNALEQRSTY